MKRSISLQLCDYFKHTDKLNYAASKVTNSDPDDDKEFLDLMVEDDPMGDAERQRREMIF